MQNRRILSYACFAIAVIGLLAIGLGSGQWINAMILFLAAGIVGAFFYRRGK